MNNIYVEGELPKCCLVCKLECPEEQRCVDGFTMDCDYCSVNERPATCPLKPLSDRLAEERKKIVQEIKKLIVESTCYDTEEEVRNHLYDMSASEVLEILDQIERGK